MAGYFKCCLLTLLLTTSHLDDSLAFQTTWKWTPTKTPSVLTKKPNLVYLTTLIPKPFNPITTLPPGFFSVIRTTLPASFITNTIIPTLKTTTFATKETTTLYKPTVFKPSTLKFMKSTQKTTTTTIPTGNDNSSKTATKLTTQTTTPTKISYSILLIYKNQSDLLNSIDFDNNLFTSQVTEQLSTLLSIPSKNFGVDSDIVITYLTKEERLTKGRTVNDVFVRLDVTSEAINQSELINTQLKKANLTIGNVTLVHADSHVWRVHGPCPVNFCSSPQEKCDMLQSSNGTFFKQCVSTLIIEPTQLKQTSFDRRYLLFLLLLIPIFLIILIVCCVICEKNKQSHVSPYNRDIMNAWPDKRELPSIHGEDETSEIIIMGGVPASVISGQDSKISSQNSQMSTHKSKISTFKSRFLTSKSKKSTVKSKMSEKVYDNNLFKEEKDYDTSSSVTAAETLKKEQDSDYSGDQTDGTVHVENMF